MCSIRGTWKNVERKEYLHRNQNETLLRPGSASLAIRLRMLESEERRRVKAVSGRDELAEENQVHVEEKKSEMNKQERSLGLKKQWYKRLIAKKYEINISQNVFHFSSSKCRPLGH